MTQPFGPFLVGEELGRGAVGTVYEARDTRLDRPVALKMLRALAQDPVRLERFRREALAQAKVSHPNVVAIHEVGQIGGVPFIAMELVRGKSLRETLKRRGRFEPRAALALAAQVARGLDAVHAAGVVHRDLKLENVLLDERGTPRVVDFGLAKESSVPALESLSLSGTLVGSPVAMAPEQVAGRKELISPRTDVWALGVLLHELISGEPPFQAKELVALLGEIMTGDPAPLGATGPGSAEAAAIVARALCKKPEDRFESAAAFAEACEGSLARRSSAVSRSVKFVVPAAVALALGLALGRLTAPAPSREPAPSTGATPIAGGSVARTGQELVLLARGELLQKSKEGLARLASAPAGDADAALVEAGLRVLARSSDLDLDRIEREAKDDATLDAAALGFLLAGDRERARGAAVFGSPLGELVRRLAPELRLLDVALVTSHRHGRAVEGRVATAGATVIGTPKDGGPVRAYSIDRGAFVGYADPRFVRAPRRLASGDGALGWTGPRSATLAFEGVTHDVHLEFDPESLGFVDHHRFFVADPRARLIADVDPIARSHVVTKLAFGFSKVTINRSLLSLTAYQVEDGQGRPAVRVVRTVPAVEQKEYLVEARDSPVAPVQGRFAIVEPSGESVALVDLDPASAKRVPVPGSGHIHAIAASREAGVFAVARGSSVSVFYDAETLDLLGTTSVDDEVLDLAFGDGLFSDDLIAARRSLPPLALELSPGEHRFSIEETAEQLFRSIHHRAPDAGNLANLVGHAREVVGRSRSGSGQGKNDRHLRWYLRRLLVRDGAKAGDTRPPEPSPLDERLVVGGAFVAEETAGAAVFLDADGERIVTGGWDGAVRLDDARGETVWEHWRDAPIDDVQVIDAPLDRRRFLVELDSSISGATVSVLPLEATQRGRVGRAGVSATGPGFSIGAISPLGERVVVASPGGPGRHVITLALADPPDESLHIEKLPDGAGAARAIALSPDGATLATALAGGDLVIESMGETKRIESAALSSVAAVPLSDTFLAIEERSGRVVLLEPSRASARPWPELPAKARAIAASPDGLLVAIVLDDGAISVRSFPSGDERARQAPVALAPDASVKVPLAWSDDGTRIVAGSGPLSVFSVARPTLTASERARFLSRLELARKLSESDPRKAWALALAVSRAPGPLADSARELARKLEPSARAAAWDAAARLVTGSERARLESLAARIRESAR